MIDVAIYGAGGFGREVAWLIDCCNHKDSLYNLVGFVDDNAELHGRILNGIKVMGLEECCRNYSQVQIVRGTGPVTVSEQIMGKVAALGYQSPTLIHPNVECSHWNEIGEGAIICAGSILTTNIILGCHVQINLGCTIGHNVVMGDYSTLAPGVHVSGWVHMGRRVYVGTGAVIINGTSEAPLVIGDDAIIGAGACVTRSVPAKNTMVGVPARPLRKKN